jgi:dTDP-4-amino-4,6-dideoxygalactose transaminase
MHVKNTKPYIPKDDITPILDDIKIALENGNLTFGTDKFEEEFAKYTGTKYAVAVNSGTSALEAPLRYFGIKGKEVIVPTNTFVASANAVVFAGGTPVMVDMDVTNLCADFENIKKKVNKNTAGVIIVHSCGYIPPYIFELRKFCDDNGLFLLEDAAHAHGASINHYDHNIKAGSIGHIGSFSFFPTKLMTTGEGGMVTTNNKELADYVKQVRHHGQKNGLMTELGYNWRMSTLNAILGRHQLKRLDSFIKRRNEIATKYAESFQGIEEIELIKVPKHITHGYWKYPILIKSKYTAKEFQTLLKEKYNIDTGTVYYPPVHLQPYYKENYGYKEGDMPISETSLTREICLPIFVDITDEQLNYVIKSVKKELS